MSSRLLLYERRDLMLRYAGFAHATVIRITFANQTHYLHSMVEESNRAKTVPLHLASAHTESNNQFAPKRKHAVAENCSLIPRSIRRMPGCVTALDFLQTGLGRAEGRECGTCVQSSQIAETAS